MDRLLDLHNKYRKERKPWRFLPFTKPNPPPELTLSVQLMLYAQEHADWMAKNQILKHSKMSDIMALRFSPVAENIAYGQKTPEAVMKAWMNSRGHRTNILNPSFVKMGWGVAKTKAGENYWCVVFGG